jgi:hypothetical protein
MANLIQSNNANIKIFGKLSAGTVSGGGGGGGGGFVSPVNTTLYDSSGNILDTVNGNVPNAWKQFQNIAGYVDIGTSAAIIGSSSFGYNQITSVTIPDSVTSIGSGAFWYNAPLTTVNCYAESTVFTGAMVFYGTASPLTIHARATDSSWTEGIGLFFQSNNNVTVIKDL